MDTISKEDGGYGMRLILTRHGETYQNKDHILQGQMQTELDEKGVADAERLSTRLNDEQFTHIYSSDMQRTVQTAEIVARHHKATVTFTPLLRERNLGVKEGTPKALFDVDHESHPEGGETLAQLKERAKAFLEELPEEGNILVVGHQAIDKALISVMLDMPYEETPHLRNTSVSIFEKSEGRWSQVIIDDISHLE